MNSVEAIRVLRRLVNNAAAYDIPLAEASRAIDVLEKNNLSPTDMAKRNIERGFCEHTQNFICTACTRKIHSLIDAGAAK